jgi:hypothetical protein
METKMKNSILGYLAVLCVLGLTTACNSINEVPTALPTEQVSTPIPTETELPPIPLPFYEDFSSDINGWPTGVDKKEFVDVTYQITNGVYRWTTNSKKDADLRTWLDLTPVKNFTAIVDSRQVSGNPEACDFGLVYRGTDGEAFLTFSISDSNFSIYEYTKTGGWKELIPWTSNESILPNVVNQLKVVSENGNFTFFANDALLADVTNSTITEGQVGLTIDQDQGNQAVYEFDNFSVTTP